MLIMPGILGPGMVHSLAMGGLLGLRGPGDSGTGGSVQRQREVSVDEGMHGL